MFSISALKTRMTVGLAACGAALAVAPSAQATTADALTYPPTARPNGLTYSQVATNWEKFVLSQPLATNPLNDTTGAKCKNGQSGLFWYLVGTQGGAPVRRSCTVPVGRTIVIPIVNSAYAALTTDPPAERTEAFLRSQTNPPVLGATGLSASLDGSPISNPRSFFEQSTLFRLTLPAGNIYGVPGGTVIDPVADAGYYLAFYPLAPGKHTIKVAGTFPDGTTIDATYDITQSFLP